MASETDTSREVVERLAYAVASEGAGFRTEAHVIGCLRTQVYSSAALAEMATRMDAGAATLRALLSERDAATARAEFLRTELDLQLDNLDATKRELADLERHFGGMLKQRDAAIAERDRLREALEKAAIAAEVESAGHAIAIIEAALTSAKEA